MEVSDATIEVLRKGIEYGQLSNGAFDITIGKATDLWYFLVAGDTALAAEGSGVSAADKVVEGEVAAGEAMPGEIPNAQVLAEAMRHVDYSKVEIDGNTVRLADPKMELDLGGIAKGYTSDRIMQVLADNGVPSGIVSLGGNVQALGGKPDGVTKEINIVKWGVYDPMIDIRRWQGDIASKGISLQREEAQKLMDAMKLVLGETQAREAKHLDSPCDNRRRRQKS